MSKGLALLYARVSTNKQAEGGHSLDSQSQLLVTKAEQEGYQVELVLEEGSGRRVNRPKLNEALERLDRGEAQALLVVDIDRLARSTIHALQVAERAKLKGWRLIVLSLDIDTETPPGRVTLGMLAVFAQFESDLISERVKRQHQARRERGKVWGIDEGFKGNLDPTARKLIVTERQKGKSLREIAATLETKGLKTPRGGEWHAATIRAVLNSPQSKVLVRG